MDAKEIKFFVKRIFTKFSEGKSLEEIRDYINSYGIKTKRGNKWSSEGVRISLRLTDYFPLYQSLTHHQFFYIQIQYFLYTNLPIPTFVFFL